MNIGILIPGFGADEDDWALPVYQNLVRELTKSHHVRVITLRYPHTREPYMYHKAEVYPLGYGAWTKGIKRLRLWWDTFQTIKHLHSEHNFDILHGIWADETGALSGWVGKQLGIPSVVTVAGGELVGFSDIQYGLQISRYGRWIVKQAIESNHVAVSPYKHHLNQHLKDSNYIPLSIEYISLGVDTDIFYPSDIPRKAKHLVHVGSLIPVKNQKFLLDTITLLEDDVTLDIIGEGYLEEELKQYAEQLRIRHRVTLLGKIPHRELRQYYSQAQLHIITSRHEAFGMSILEAAACGTPTIGTHVGLISDDMGFTKLADTPQQLAQTIQSLLKPPSELEQLQSDCEKIVKRQFTIDHIAQQHIKLYQNLSGV